MQAKKEITEVEEPLGKLPRAGKVQEAAVLVTEHQAAARRREDDVYPLPDRREEQVDVPLPHLPRPAEVPDAETGDAAAALRRDDDRKAVRL